MVTKRCEAAQSGHRHVEQQHIRLERCDEMDGFGAICRFADDLKLGLGLQEHLQPFPDDRMIVGDDNPDA